MAEIGDHVKSVGPSAGEWVHVSTLKPWKRNPRHNDGRPTEKVAESIRRFGFISPIVVWRSAGQIVAGHTRLKALQSLLSKDPKFAPKGAPGPGLVPVRFHEFDNQHEADLYAIADNKLNEEATWDDGLVDEILRDASASDRSIVGFDESDSDVWGDPVELVAEEIDTSTLETASFMLTVSGPLPVQPDVLEQLTAALRDIEGVTVVATRNW